MLGSGAPNAGIGAGASGPGDRPRSFRVERHSNPWTRGYLHMAVESAAIP